MEIRLYYSYADADKALRARLETHLAALQRSHEIAGWHSRLLPAGAEQREESARQLAEAEIILVLLSPDYLASPKCYDDEAQQALARHRQAQAWIIPVLLRPVDLEGTPFARLQLLPSNGKPVATWRDRDQAFVDIVQGIRQAIDERPGRRAGQGPLLGVTEDEAGVPLFLCSDLLGFCTPLRLSLDQPVGAHLDRIARDLALPAGLDLKGRVGLSFRYQLACEDRTLLRAKSLAQQGVGAGALLVLEVSASPWAATPPARTDDGALIYRHDGPADEASAIAWLRRHLADAGW